MKNITVLLNALSLFLALSSEVDAQNYCTGWQQRDSSFHYVPFANANPPYYRNDDASTDGIILPFTFCFWGTPSGNSSNSLYINNNGNISFGQPNYTFSADTFPVLNASTGFSEIAPFWADVETLDSIYPGSNVVVYKIAPHYMIVQWDSVGYYNGDSMRAPLHRTCSFQLIISDGTDPIIPNGNNVSFCYKNMEWTTGKASGGLGNGYGGNPATVGANEGDGIRFIQIGLFDTSGASYSGQYPPAPHYDGVAWLDNKNFIFNLCAGTVAPLISGISACDTFKVCEKDTMLIPLYFYTPIQGGFIRSNLLSPVLSGVSIFSNKQGGVDSLIIEVMGSESNLGPHTVNLYGYDNQNPHDTTYASFVIDVEPLPKPIITGTTPVLRGTTDTLTASGGISYIWSNGSTQNTYYTGAINADSTMTLVTYNILGCQSETTFTISIDIPCADLSIPNVLTPNYAGVSGVDKVFYIKAYSNIDAWSLVIFDQWGKEMFKTTQPTQYWNGTTESGGQAPDGVYYYMIDATCQNNTYKKDGFVQLIR